MAEHELLAESKAKMDKAVKSLERDLVRVRTGRASITVLEGVRVNYYGNPTALNQISSLSVPDARTIVISPFEKSLIPEIEKAIMKADLGLQPGSDGNIVRVPVPQLTEDRRKDIVKGLKKLGEEAKVQIRNVRRDINEAVKKLEKDKALNEDDAKKLLADIQKVTDQFGKQVDEKLTAKEKEVMTI